VRDEGKRLTRHVFWGGRGGAVNCVVYLLNRNLSKPTVSHLRVLGYIAHVKVVWPNLKKLDDRSTPMIFVRYDPGSAAYTCYNPVTKSVHISTDVIFDEEAMWNWPGDQATEMEFDVSFRDQTETFQTMRTEMTIVDVSGSGNTDPRAHDVGSVLIQEEGKRQGISPPQSFRSPAIGGGSPL
jgi:hypothetical protein